MKTANKSSENVANLCYMVTTIINHYRDIIENRLNTEILAAIQFRIFYSSEI